MAQEGSVSTFLALPKEEQKVASLMERLSFGGLIPSEEGGTRFITGKKKSDDSESEKTRKNKQAFMGTLFAFNAIALLVIGYVLIAVKGSIFTDSPAINGIEYSWILLFFLLLPLIFMFIHIDYIFKKNNHCSTEPKKLYNQSFAGLFLIIFGIFALGLSFIYPYSAQTSGKINTFIATYFVFVIIGVGLTLDAMNLKKCKETDKELKSFRDVSITGIVFQLLAALLTVGMATMQQAKSEGNTFNIEFPRVDFAGNLSKNQKQNQPRTQTFNVLNPVIQVTSGVQ
jgi:MFS family permease